ncbi:MAG TPA: hypothetical protein VGK59_01940 [Ohtaekwangia sp.]
MKGLMVKGFCSLLLLMAIVSCKAPEQDVVLRRIKDVVVDATSEPTLKAQAVLFNPNKHHGKLKRIKMEIFVNEKKAGTVDQKLNITIPGNDEFSVPLEVKLATKEFGFLDTLLGVFGGKKFDVHYVGSIRVSYHGLPVRVPVDYKDQVRVKF